MMQRARLCSSASTAVQSQQDPVVAGAHDNVVVVGAMFMSMLTNKMHSRLVACTVDANQPRPNKRLHENMSRQQHGWKARTVCNANNIFRLTCRLKVAHTFVMCAHAEQTQEVLITECLGGVVCIHKGV